MLSAVIKARTQGSRHRMRHDDSTYVEFVRACAEVNRVPGIYSSSN